MINFLHVTVTPPCLPGVCLSLSSACPLYHHLAAGLTINADYSHNKLQNTRSRVSLEARKGYT